MRLSRVILFILICGFVGQAAIYYSILPDPMASHFNGLGRADNWMSKRGFFIFEFAILLIIIFEFTLLPFLIERMPNSLINLPNKSYWLAPERRAQTFAAFREFFEWFSAVLLTLFIIVNQLVFRANVRSENLPGTLMWVIVGIFILSVVVWLAKFVRHFKNTS